MTRRAPAVHRRAPLRPDRHPGRAPTAPPAPAVHRRAPLRQHAGRTGRQYRACSRRSTVGSIAEVQVYWDTMPDAPAVQRRAPLRRYALGAAGQAGPLLPPFTGGLHCGNDLRGSSCSAAPCCSRRSPAGSIAATVTSATRTTSGRCSRRSTAGSIAAGRHLGDSWVGSCSRRSTAGSIAARSPRSRSPRTSPILPPFTGGPHCGTASTRRPGRTRTAPAVTGGPHCGGKLDACAGSCRSAPAPAVHWRAPLRRLERPLTNERL